MGGMPVARFVWAALLVGLVVMLLGIPLLLGHPSFPPHRPTNVSTPANIVYGAISGFLLGDESSPWRAWRLPDVMHRT